MDVFDGVDEVFFFEVFFGVSELFVSIGRCLLKVIVLVYDDVLECCLF